MNSKTKIKILVDIAMSIVLFICMSYQFIGQEKHEIAGAVMLVLFILHHILNIRWFMRLSKGKYGTQRIFLTAIDFAILITMLLLMISGIRMSRTVFAFLDLKFIGMGTARSVHMVASYFGFLLFGIHIGLHFAMIQNMMRKMFKIQSRHQYRIWILRGIDLSLVIYGLYALLKRNFLSYITLRMHFVFFDYTEPVIFYLIDLMAIMILMGSIGYYTQKCLTSKRKEQCNEGIND